MEQKSTLSKKKQAKLYETVSNDIMDARIDIQLMFGNKLNSQDLDMLDKRLFNLSVKCPQNAIELFYTN